MKSGKEKVPFYENSSSYTLAGLMALAGCALMLASAFLNWKSLVVMTDEKVTGGVTFYKVIKQGLDSIFIRNIDNEITNISFNFNGALPVILSVLFAFIILFLLIAGIKDNFTRTDFFVNKKKRIRIISLLILIVIVIIMTHTTIFRGITDQLQELSKSWGTYVEEAQKNHVNGADKMYVHYHLGMGGVFFWIGVVLYFGSVVLNFILETLNED